MSVVYVTEPSGRVRRQGEGLYITRPTHKDRGQETVLQLATHSLELISLFGHTGISAEAMQLCLEQGIAVAWFASSGQYLGRVSPPMARSADIRLAQYALSNAPEARLALSKLILDARLTTQTNIIRDFQKNKGSQAVLSEAIEGFDKIKEMVKTTGSMEALLGVEGNAARTWFDVLGRTFLTITFSGRNRRPPRDPVNALLSFGYTLLANLLAGAIEARGFDPSLGFIHATRPGRPALALDLMEEFRAFVVDRFVLRVCNLKILRPEHFTHDEDKGIRLTREGMRTFFTEWERALLQTVSSDKQELDVRALLRRQVDRLAAHVRGQTGYAPFCYGEAKRKRGRPAKTQT